MGGSALRSVIDYCPECDKLIPMPTRECHICRTRTLRLTYDIPENLFAPFAFILLLLLIIAFMVMDPFGNFVRTAIAGIIFMISLMICFFYFIYWESRPAQEAALKRGRELYKANQERHAAGEAIEEPDITPMPSEFPWSIRNLDGLLIALVASIILMPVPILYGIFLFEGGPREVILVWGFVMVGLMAPMFIWLVYTPAKRIYEVIRALKLEPHEIRKSFDSLVVTSASYGRFELNHDPDAGYKLRVQLDHRSVEGIEPQVVWKRAAWGSRPPGTEPSRYLPMSDIQLQAIRSLDAIVIENDGEGSHVTATIQNRLFYEESQDVELILNMLREIKSGIEARKASG